MRAEPALGLRVQGFRGSGVQGFKEFRGFRGLGVHGFRVSRLQSFGVRGLGVCVAWGCHIQDFGM